MRTFARKNARRFATISSAVILATSVGSLSAHADPKPDYYVVTVNFDKVGFPKLNDCTFGVTLNCDQSQLKGYVEAKNDNGIAGTGGDLKPYRVIHEKPGLASWGVVHSQEQNILDRTPSYKYDEYFAKDKMLCAASWNFNNCSESDEKSEIKLLWKPGQQFTVKATLKDDDVASDDDIICQPAMGFTESSFGNIPLTGKTGTYVMEKTAWDDPGNSCKINFSVTVQPHIAATPTVGNPK
ncbi:hypothetical protein [Streptomyces sp. NPDC048508]|uniref:hypothetical protein n=1 Tax=Streptomyces sp. NPDC048508 TaxID=3365561 RepID=UPI0037230BF9